MTDSLHKVSTPDTLHNVALPPVTDTANVLVDTLTIPVANSAAIADCTLIVVPSQQWVSPQELFGAHTSLVAVVGKQATTEPRNFASSLFEGFLALGIIFLFLAFFRYVRNFFSSLVAGLFSYQASEKQFKENSLSVAITNRVLLVFALMSISFFCWLLWLHNTDTGRSGSSPWYSFAWIGGGICAYFLIKTLLLLAIDYVGKSAPLMHLVIHFGRLYTIAAGFALFPVALLIAASDPGIVFNTLMVISLVITALCVLFYFLRIVQIFFTARVSGFFLFLYLCTLELAPFLVLYSLVSVS